MDQNRKNKIDRVLKIVFVVLTFLAFSITFRTGCVIEEKQEAIDSLEAENWYLRMKLKEK